MAVPISATTSPIVYQAAHCVPVSLCNPTPLNPNPEHRLSPNHQLWKLWHHVRGHWGYHEVLPEPVRLFLVTTATRVTPSQTPQTQLQQHCHKPQQQLFMPNNARRFTGPTCQTDRFKNYRPAKRTDSKTIFLKTTIPRMESPEQRNLLRTIKKGNELAPEAAAERNTFVSQACWNNHNNGHL